MTNFNERIAELADANELIYLPIVSEIALPLLCEMAQALSEARAENERLRAGIKDVAAKFAEMEKLRSQFYTEKEQAETALLFANRENERLRAGVGKAIKDLKHISNCAEQMGETAEHVFGNAIKELEALHDA